MLLAETESGTKYLIDMVNMTVQRTGKPIVMTTKTVDASHFEGVLHFRNDVSPEVGASLHFIYTDGTWSLSTPVVSLTEVEAEKETDSNDLA